jgi:co-chaperonin GroES (HSP10)
MKVEAIANHIIFQFVDEIVGGQFRTTSESGIIVELGNHESSSGRGRWGKVLSKGPRVSDQVKEGEYVFIEKLMWTAHVTLNKEKLWMTTEEKVLLSGPEYT